MMTIYKNVLNKKYNLCQKISFITQVEIVKIRKDNKNTKSHF